MFKKQDFKISKEVKALGSKKCKGSMSFTLRSLLEILKDIRAKMNKGFFKKRSLSLRSKEIYLLILILFSAAFLLFAGLGGNYLWDRDETFYAEVAREMMLHGTWSIPYFNGEYFLEKPPFAYWMMILSYRLFGVNEFSARFFTAFFALLTILLTFFMGSFFYCKRVGFLSSVILLTTLFFFTLSKAAITDSFLLFFMTGAIFSFFFALTANRKLGLVLFYPLLGLCVLAKGPVGLLVPGAIIFSFLLLTKELKFVKKMALVLGAPVFLLIALPWYMIVAHETGGGLFSEFIFRHNIQRFFSESMHGHGGPFFYYFPVVIFGFFPWSAFLIQSLKIRIKDKSDLFLLLWAVIPFIFFSLSRTKLPHYILPIFPPLAVLLANFLHRVMDKSVKRPYLWPSLWFIFGVSAILFIVSLCLPFFYSDISAPALAIGFFILFVGSIVSLYFLKKDIFSGVFLSLCISMMCFGLVLSLKVLPQVNRYRIIAPLAQKIRVVIQPEDVVISYRYFEPSMVFYSQRIIQRINHPEELEKVISEPGRFFIFSRKKDFEDFYKKSDLPLFKIAQKEGLSENKGIISLVVFSTKPLDR